MIDEHSRWTSLNGACPASPPLARQRRATRVWDADAARVLLKDAATYTLATRRPDGAPVLRPLNGVLVDDWVLFHGAFAGEKMDCVGQPAVVSAYEAVATLPSYFFDPRLACPATTYFKSAMGHGTLLAVDDEDLTLRMLQALMEKYQPEGGHAHFVHERAVYEKELKSVRVFGVRLDCVHGKCNLGQDRPTERTCGVVRELWRRGAPGDLAAIEAILASSPDARPPEWTLPDPSGPLALVVEPSLDWATQHAHMLAAQYWRTQSSLEDIRTSILASQAWLGLVDAAGLLVGAARAVSDQVWVATVSDVVIRERHRGRGLGTSLMQHLLAHPAVRACRAQRLGTADAMSFYARFGFVLAGEDTTTPNSSWMVRRPATATPTS